MAEKRVRGASPSGVVAGTCYNVNYKLEGGKTRIVSYRAIEPDIMGMTSCMRRNTVRANSIPYATTTHHPCHIPHTEETQFWWCKCESRPWLGQLERFLKRQLKPVLIQSKRQKQKDAHVSLPERRS